MSDNGLTPAEVEADEQAAGNDRTQPPYVVEVDERIAAGAAARVALDRGNPEPLRTTGHPFINGSCTLCGAQQRSAPWGEGCDALGVTPRGMANISVGDATGEKSGISQRDDGAAWQADFYADEAARRSQPAPRTVSAAEIDRVRMHADYCATAAYARGDEDERRRWLDALALIERITVEAPRG